MMKCMRKFKKSEGKAKKRQSYRIKYFKITRYSLKFDSSNLTLSLLSVN